jgi:adenylyltransferase/sulfurtransferase
VGIIGSWAAMEALKVLTGKTPHTDLARFDFWQDERQFLKPPKSRCRFCTDKVTEFLDARWSLKASALCGLEGVQIRVNPPGKLNLAVLKERLESRTHSPWKQAGLMLKGHEGPDEITLFADGRALVHGPMTPERARSWYTEVVGC